MLFIAKEIENNHFLVCSVLNNDNNPNADDHIERKT